MSKRDAVRVMNIREVDGQLVNVRVEDLVHEADTRRLERVLVGELDMDLPHATGERCCWKRHSVGGHEMRDARDGR